MGEGGRKQAIFILSRTVKLGAENYMCSLTLKFDYSPGAALLQSIIPL